MAGGQWLSIESPDQDSVLFLDVAVPGEHDAEDAAARIRSAPPSLTATVTRLVARVPPTSDITWRAALGAGLYETLERLHLHPDVSIITLPVASPPTQMSMSHDSKFEEVEWDPALLGRARRVELTAMLRHNNGIWTPTDYHFRLPSGAHGSSFVRVADAIRTPRDALAIASWLAPHVGKSTGILLDSASLVGVATALEAIVARAGRELGPVVSLEEYPKNRLDTMKAVRDVDRGSNVIGVLSVHSTGSLLDRLQTALDQVASHEWTLQVLVDKAGAPGGELYPKPDVSANAYDRTVVWSRLGAERDVPREDCVSCRRGPARIAQIDPRTFDGMVLPSPELLMPSATWAYEHGRFWELVDAADAVTLEAPSDVSGLHPRYGTDKFMSVKINFGDLLADPVGEAVAAAARERLESLVARGKLVPPYDLVLVDERESDLAHFDAFIGNLLPVLGGPETMSVRSSVEDLEKDAVERITKSKHILIFRLGLVSGLSLQQTMYGVQQLRRGTGPYNLDGLIVHLRPQDGRVRETLANSLARHLASLWESYLPEDRHPLQEEQDIITSFHDEVAPHVKDFLGERLALCSGFPANGQILWDAGPHDAADARRLSPMSYFGEGLRVRSAYAAIGSAVHHARMKADAPRSAPVWRMFDMQAIMRSYYDPIIICCVVRWMRSTEVWWGDDLRTAESMLVSVLRRTGDVEKVMLVSELLLAGAQAKVPRELCDVLQREGRLLADHVGAPSDASLRLGLLITKDP